MEWNKSDAIAYAVKLANCGPAQVVYKREDRINYNVCHLLNLQRTIDYALCDGVKLELCMIISKGVKQ